MSVDISLSGEHCVGSGNGAGAHFAVGRATNFCLATRVALGRSSRDGYIFLHEVLHRSSVGWLGSNNCCVS